MQSIIYVLKRPAYFVCALGGAIVGYGIISFSIHASLVMSLLSSSHVLQTIPAVIHILIWGTYTVGGWMAVVTSTGIALLWGITVSLSVFYMRHAKTMRAITGSGIRGILALIGGVLSAGCWACGGFLVGPLLGMIVGGVSITLLYIGGTVVSLTSFALLIYSLYKVTRAIKMLHIHSS